MAAEEVSTEKASEFGSRAVRRASTASDAARRFKRISIAILIVYAAIIVRGDGEFWPFSKFPMFSRAGRPWTRALVVELTEPVPDSALVEVWEKELPGPAFALHHYQINQDDLSAVVRGMTLPLTSEHTDFLAKYFERVRHDRTLVLYSVRGRFRQDKSVRERFTPLALIGPEGARYLAPPPDAGVPLGEAGAPEAGALEAGASLDAGTP